MEIRRKRSLGDLLLLAEVEDLIFDLLLGEFVRREHLVLGKLPDAMDVAPLRTGGERQLASAAHI
jgi:hypothetical protein